MIRNTSAELKILSISNDCKLMKLESKFAGIWKWDFSDYLELNCKHCGKYTRWKSNQMIFFFNFLLYCCWFNGLW